MFYFEWAVVLVCTRSLVNHLDFTLPCLASFGDAVGGLLELLKVALFLLNGVEIWGRIVLLHHGWCENDTDGEQRGGFDWTVITGSTKAPRAVYMTVEWLGVTVEGDVAAALLVTSEKSPVVLSVAKDIQ